jgi:hypothetical protein
LELAFVASSGWGRGPLTSRLFLTKIIPQKLPAVFVFMAIDAEIFPIGAIRGIILGIAVLMMHRQELPIPLGEFPAALGANHPVNLQGALPII